jgi:hypothetical protein
MPIDDPNELERIDQQIRINELKAAAAEAAGGDMTTWESEDCPPDIAEQFWKHVLEFENAPESPHFQQLTERGIDLPPPSDLNDEQLHDKLWEVMRALAEMNTYVMATNHLSDRELYERLWSDVLHESTYPGMDCYLDLVSSGSEEDTAMWLRYYADEETRARWRADFPEFVLPPRQRPPHDRDRFLPQSRLE